MPLSGIREDNCLKHWERFLGGDISISQITSRHILAYRGGLLERGLSASTANHHVKALRAVMRLARTEKYIAKLPMDGASVVPKGRLTIARRFNAGYRFAAPKSHRDG